MVFKIQEDPLFKDYKFYNIIRLKTHKQTYLISDVPIVDKVPVVDFYS